MACIRLLCELNSSGYRAVIGHSDIGLYRLEANRAGSQSGSMAAASSIRERSDNVSDTVQHLIVDGLQKWGISRPNHISRKEFFHRLRSCIFDMDLLFSSCLTLFRSEAIRNAQDMKGGNGGKLYFIRF